MKFKSIVAAIAVTLGLIAIPTAAQAKPFCGSGYICLYDDLGGTSLMAKKYWTDWSQSVCYGMGSLDNRISYVVNDSVHDIIVSLNNSCSGTTAVLHANSYGPMNQTWNNTISAGYRVD